MTINGLDLNNPKQKIFFTSDLHFCHKGVMSFHPRFRDFKSVGAMDNALINMWNSTVGDDDVVFNLYGHVHDADLSEFLGERSLNICYDSLGRMMELGEVLSTLKRGKIKPCVHNDFMDDE